jgi:Fe-S cluster assembly protein SufD
MAQASATEMVFRPDFSAVGEGEQPLFLRSLRISAQQRFAELGLPTRRDEEWRFTPLKTIADTAYAVSDVPGKPTDLERWSLGEGHRMVFVDGHFAPSLSSLDGLPRSVVVADLPSAAARRSDLVEPHLGRVSAADGSTFEALNTALHQDGALVHIPRGVVVEQMIHLLFVSTRRTDPAASYPRNLVVIEDGARAVVVETHAAADSASFSCPLTEIVLAEGAFLEHVKLVEDTAVGSHIGAQHVRQARGSELSSHSISLGGELVRNDLRVSLEGENAQCSLGGLYLAQDRQTVDNHLRVEHNSANCSSSQLYKGVLDDAARAVFNGRVVVAPGAQKTDARQSNRNLLLSDRAKVNSNPQLEIFADDVRCTHGSVVGRLDEEAVFYLRSRGIGRREAENLLTHAFAAEVVESIGVAAVRERLQGVLGDRLPLVNGVAEKQP